MGNWPATPYKRLCCRFAIARVLFTRRLSVPIILAWVALAVASVLGAMLGYAIVAVILVYFDRLRAVALGLSSSAAARRFVANVAIGFLPAALLGVLFFKQKVTLRQLPAQSIVLLHACCHNPTGVDLSAAQ